MLWTIKGNFAFLQCGSEEEARAVRESIGAIAESALDQDEEWLFCTFCSPFGELLADESFARSLEGVGAWIAEMQAVIAYEIARKGFKTIIVPADVDQ